VLDTAAHQAVLGQVRAAARGLGPVRPDVAVVLALTGPCRLLERVAPDRSTRGEAKKRIARAAADTPFAPGVAKIIDELIAAVAVTATTGPRDGPGRVPVRVRAERRGDRAIRGGPRL
jgi:Golgi phosphoprotein 3 (GPP34)